MLFSLSACGVTFATLSWRICLEIQSQKIIFKQQENLLFTLFLEHFRSVSAAKIKSSAVAKGRTLDVTGGDERCFDETRDSKIPLEHEYFKEDYPLAEIMRDIFKQAGLEQELKQSIKTNLNFFRSKSEKQWSEIEANLKKEIESFCEKRVKEFIDLAKPRVIFCEAFSVLERLLKILNQKTSQLRIAYRSSKASDRLYQSFKFKDFYINGIIGIPHPTGSRPRLSNEEKFRIAELLKKDARILLQ